MRTLYSLLLYLATPLILLYLAFRGIRDRDYLARWPERFGFFDAPKIAGSIVVHAVSMGEVNAASALVRELGEHFPRTPLCLTTLTPTGSERVRTLFAEEVGHVYIPLDLPGAVRRFYDRVKPRMLVVMETEIWPNLYHEAYSRQIPVIIVNARVSERSIGAYRRLKGWTGEALAKVTEIAAQSELDATRMIEIGADSRKVTVTGNLKYDITPPSGLAEQGDSLRNAWGPNRLVLTAGSTHEDDEQALLKAFDSLLGDYPTALLILAPRHPERIGRAIQLARSAGLRASLSSENPDCAGDCQCLIVDTMGALLRYYAASDVAFVGGTFAAIGGHNVLEPAALGKPVVVGPHTSNLRDIMQQMLVSQGAIQVQDVKDLEAAVRRMFNEPELRNEMGQAGLSLVKRGQGAVQRTLERISKWLTPATG